MRRISILILLLLIFLFSCSKGEERSTGTVRITAVDFPSYDAARAVVGSEEGISLLLPPGVESHSYEPTPKDMIEISESDLVIFTGGDSDQWVYRILSSLDKMPETYVLVDQVELCHKEHEEEDHHDHEFDEHVWTSPVNEIAIVDGLCRVLSELDPDNSVKYRENADAYIREIEILDKEFRALLEGKDRVMVFASRFPLVYFAEEYGVEYYAAFPGCAEESEPSARTLAFLIDKIKSENLGYVFNIEFGSPRIASVIASESGSEVRQFHTVHNLTAIEAADKESYVSLMNRNLEVLKEVFR